MAWNTEIFGNTTKPHTLSIHEMIDLTLIENKTNVISADLLDFCFDFEDIYISNDEEKKWGNKKLVKKRVW